MKRTEDNRSAGGGRRKTGLRQKIRYGGTSLLIVMMMIGSLIVLNIGAAALEKRNGWRLDWSFNGLTSHSEETKAVLKGLDTPVHIYALYRRGEEDAPLTELLNRYAAATPYVTWELADPSLNPMLISRYTTEGQSVTADSLIVECEKTGRWRVLTAEDFVSLGLDTETGSYTSAGWTYERSITRAIRTVTRERIPRVLIAQGHGELDEETAGAFAELLEANQYETAFVQLAEAGGIADGAGPQAGDLIVFLSPMRDLTEAETERMKAFADQGGSFLFTCDFTDPVERMPRYLSLLRSYGIVPMEGVVCADPEAPNTYYQNSRIQLIPEMMSTDITMELTGSGRDTVLLPGCRALETPEESDRNLVTVEVLRSGEGSYLKQMDSRTTSMERTEEDAAGPFTLAVEARRVTEGGSVSRAFAIGCSAMLTEDEIWAMTDSRQLILRTMEFLVDMEAADVDIQEKDALRPALSAGSTGAGSLLLTALPVTVALVALGVLVPRRRNR